MTFTSLCYIPSRSSNGQYWVQRIADLHGDTLVPFFPRNSGWNIPRRPENMDRFPIMNPSPLTSGQVGVFDWEGKWNEAKSRTDVSNVRYREDRIPIQVFNTSFNVSGTDSVRVLSIADRLRQGSTLPALYAKSALIRVSTGSCLLLTHDMFNGDRKLKENITSCQLVSIDRNAVRNAIFSSSDGQRISFDYYSKATIPIVNSVSLYEGIELIRKLIIEKVSKPVVKEKGFTRPEKQTFDKVLQALDLTSYEEEISRRLNCTREIARQELEKFKENARSIDLLGGDEGLLARFFDQNEKFRKDCIAEGEKRWREQNETIIHAETEKKNAVLSELAKKIDADKANVLELEKKLEENDALIREQEKEIQQRKDELARTEDAVKERLSSIQDDIPKAFAEMSVLKHLLVGTSPAHSPSAYTSGVVGTGETSILGDPISAWELLSGNLKSCGCSATKAQIAALWLLACAIRRQPLLLVGSSAESFAQAISHSLFGLKPAVLDCSCPNVKQAEDDLLADTPSVCIVRSPFSADWVGRLPGLFSRTADATQFLGCTPFYEDLVVEPPSFFHTMLPFLTDVFCEAPSPIASSNFTNGKMGFSNQTLQQLIGNTPTEVEYAGDLRLTSGAMARLGCIYATMTQFEKDLLPFTERQLARNFGAILPLAVATGKRELAESLAKSVDWKNWGLSSFLA